MRTRILIAAALALLLLPVALIGVLVYTEAGVNLIAGQVGRLERLGIHIEGISGTLSGPLRIARFELDHPRVQVVAHDIVIDPQLRGLLLQTVQVGSLTARDTLVAIREAQLPPSQRPPRFVPRYMRIDARGVALAGVRYVHVNGTVVDAERIQGRVTITSRRLHARNVRVDAKQFDAAGDLRLRAGRPLGLEANVDGRLRTGRAELTLSARADGTLDRLAIEARMRQPDTATADALFTREAERWNITGRFAAASFALDPWLAKPPFSLRNVALDFEASADQIRARGNVGIPELDRNDLTIDARGRFAQRTLRIAAADIALNNTPARLHATGTVAFDGDAPTLDLAATWKSLQWPLHDAAVVSSEAGDASVRGALPYDFNVTAQIEGANIPRAQGAAQGVLSKDQVTISQYAVGSLGGTLSGDAALQLAPPRKWSFSTQAVNVDPVELHHEFPGRLDFLARAQGLGLDRTASFTLTLSDLSGRLRGEPVSGAGTILKDASGWRVRNARMAFADARLTLDAALRDTIDARWSVKAPSLHRILPDAQGALAFDGTASGTRESPRVRADLQGRNLRYQQWRAKRFSIDANIDATGASASRLSLVASELGHGESVLDTLRMTGEGVPADHRIDIGLTGSAANPRGRVPRAELQLLGRYAEKTWNATITTTQMTRGDAEQKMASVEPATLLASRERVVLDHLCLTAGAGRICADAKWEPAGWEGSLAGYEIPLGSVLPPIGGAAEYAGRIEGRVSAFGAPGQPWRGEAGMRIIDAAIVYRPEGAQTEVLSLGTGGLAATATSERIDFSFGVQAFTDTFLYADARLLRDGSNNVMTMPLSGDLRARAADANILPLVFPEVDHAAGLLTANATVAGTLARPEINGRIELASGELDSYRVNLALRDLGAVADIADNRLDFRGTGRAGGGSLEVDGQFTWKGGESRGSLHLRGEELLVADLPDYRVVASPDLRFLIAGERLNVSGDVTVPSARIQPARIAGAVRVSEDARYVGEHPAEQAGRFVVHSEVRVGMGEDVRVDAFGLQGRITGGVGTTIHTGETPVGRGELNVDDGRYEAYGQKLRINRGRLLFDASPLDDPGLDIEARREIEKVLVGLNVRGTLQDPRITFFSDPSMPQTQIVSYLLTGKTVDSLASSDTTTISSAREALAVQGGGVLASQIGRRLGLEEIGVESSIDSEGQSDTALVLGKFLSPRLFISYGISLTESINTLKLRYTISDRWVFRTEAGEEQGADLEFTVER